MTKQRRNKNTKFFILNGVRRALVAREAGRKTIPAIIYQEGRAPKHRSRMRLDRLYSSKHAVAIDDRYERIDLPIVEPITIEPIRARGQQPSIPLRQVILE